MNKPILKLDWCDAKAARYACETWHYSRSMPSSGVKIGVWEDGVFVGAVLFGVGAANVTRGERYGLARSHDIAELMRVALSPKHTSPTSKIVSVAIRMVRKQSPSLKAIISFADEMRAGHIGTIYQAMGFVYLGTFEGDGGYVIRGKIWHSKSVHSAGWVQSLDWIRKHIDPNARNNPTKKHRYMLPLTEDLRKSIGPMSLPYPKRASSAESGTTGNQPVGGGANPTVAL